MSSTPLAAAAAAAALLTATACGLSGFQEVVPVRDGAEAPEAAPGPPPRADAQASPEAVRGYMDALAATADPDAMGEGLDRAVEESAAHTFLLHRASIARARADQGEPADDARLEETAEGFRLCEGAEPSPSPSPSPSPDSPCAEYTGFTGEGDRVTGLLVNGQDPGPRLVAGGGTAAESEGVEATLLTAHQSAADKTLSVTAEFTTADDVDLDLFGATYMGADGNEYDAAEAMGRYELDGGTATHTAFYFPDAAPGGDLTVRGCLDECLAFVEITLPVQ